MERITRVRGSLLGLAAGDALGIAFEGRDPEPVLDVELELLGDRRRGLAPGDWGAPTAMALCLGESLGERGGVDPIDQLDRYHRWYRTGRTSSNGRCFAIGETTRVALCRFEATGHPYCGSEHPLSASNGSLARTAPVALWFADDGRAAVERAAECSRTTHAAREAIDACRYLAALIVGALRGHSRREILGPRFEPVPGLWSDAPLSEGVRRVAEGSFKESEPPEVRGSCLAVDSLEAALWAFHRARSFRHGAELAVALGDEAPTTGAVYGQLAGAYWGDQAIPRSWKSALSRRELIETVARGIHSSTEEHATHAKSRHGSSRSAASRHGSSQPVASRNVARTSA